MNGNAAVRCLTLEPAGAVVQGLTTTNAIVYYNTAVTTSNINTTAGVGYSCGSELTNGTGNVTVPPAFKATGSGFGFNHMAGDYHLESASPCIDAGFNLGWTATGLDLDGARRLQGRAVDIPQELVFPRRFSRRGACLRPPAWWRAGQGKRGRQAEDAEGILFRKELSRLFGLVFYDLRANFGLAFVRFYQTFALDLCVRRPDIMHRTIFGSLETWAAAADHSVLLLRGARQVGKTYAIRHLSRLFGSYLEVNFEEEKELRLFFDGSLDPAGIVRKLSNYFGSRIEPGRTLLFFDEIQACPDAIRSLRFFQEKMPKLHVIACGSLLEFALESIPSHGVGRIMSLFMFPMSFEEFLLAMNDEGLVNEIRGASPRQPLSPPFHSRGL
jgi:hypothetical protein